MVISIKDKPAACPILVNPGTDGMCPFTKSNDPHFLVSLTCVECCRKYSKPQADHTTDSDCTLDLDNVCTVCGVYHGDPCTMCGGKGFHNGDCPVLVR